MMGQTWSLHGLSGEALLWWGVIGAALLVLFFFLRPRPISLAVSSDLLWRRALPRRSNPLIREIVLLVLQLLVLACLLGALGDPRPEADAVVSEDSGDRVWVVDRSRSMAARDEAGRTRLDRVRQDLLAQLQALDSRVQIALIGAGRTPELLAAPSRERSRLRLAIEQLRPDQSAADLAAALHLADGLEGFPTAPQLELFTDSGDAEAVLEARRTDGMPPVLLRAPFQLRPNLAITAFRLRGSEGIPAEEEALVRVANLSPWPARTHLKIESEKEVLGSAELELEAGSEVIRRYRFDPLDDSVLLARLSSTGFADPDTPELVPDALPEDDVAWAWVEPVRPVRVMLVSEGNRYLERALALIPQVRLERVRPSSWGRRKAARARSMDLVFFDRFLPEGSLPPRAFVIAPPEDRSPSEIVARLDEPSITDWNRDHPLFADLVLRDLEVQSSLVFAPKKGDERLLGGPSGPLALARSDRKGRKLVVWGFEFARSDLPLRLAFPQIIFNSLLWMREGRAVGPKAGEEIALAEELVLGGDVDSGLDDPREARIERLSGLSLPSLDETSPSPVLDLFDTAALAPTARPVVLPGPGLYRISSGGRERYVSAQMLESAESRLFPLPPQDAAAEAELPEPVEVPVLPTVWLLLAGLVLLLLVVEFGGWLK